MSQLKSMSTNIMCDQKKKFLGVIIDNKLTWKEHTSYICGNVA